eukprot:TRINITY_DN1250_c0_g1_i2.p1 TRINITY_DN1250_c0_g1~~TRINITY_DN1250_c0_g1_i2.p1  ORF type:complete len:108 (-),score=30.02 TRINITY_DN1250_c0_g1_i2:164-487(-)
MGGLWGVLATGLFAKKEYVEEVYGLDDIDSYGGWMGGGGKQFGVQLFGAFMIMIWTFGNSVVLFGILKATGNLRINSELEAEGVDKKEHGTKAYILHEITNNKDLLA